MSRFLPPYVDLDTAYRRPTTTKPAQTGWFHQVAYNLDQMWYAYDVGSGATSSGAVTETPVPWVNITAGATDRYMHLRVGELAYVWAETTSGTLSSSQAGIELPYPPAVISAPQAVGRGVLTFSGGQYSLLPVLSPGSSTALFHLIDGILTNATGIGASRIAVQMSYRIDRPTDGRVAGRSYVVDHGGPLS